MTNQEWNDLTREERVRLTLGNNQDPDEFEVDLERASKLTRSQLLRELGESR